MSKDKQALGQKGEDAACCFLEKSGHKIIARNYRYGRSELDIVSLFEDALVVSEVKSFVSRPLGAAEYRVNKKKQQQIIQGTYGFLEEYPEHQGRDIRLDVIIVDYSSYPESITHYPGAFWQDSDDQLN